MTEFLDIYDDNLVHKGVKERQQVHRDGDWHRVFHCWVIAPKTRTVIFQKRASTKASFPDYLDTSAAGHIEAGETIAASIRELHEELGLIDATIDDLLPLGLRSSMAQYNGRIDRELAHVFFYECDCPLMDYAYQKDEVAGLVAVLIDDGLRLFSGDVDQIIVPSFGLTDEKLSVSREDFVPTFDQYHYRVLILADRWLRGEKHLVI